MKHIYDIGIFKRNILFINIQVSFPYLLLINKLHVPFCSLMVLILDM